MNIYQIVLLTTLNVLHRTLRFAWTNYYSVSNNHLQADLMGCLPLGLSSINSILVFRNTYEMMEKKLHPPNKPHPT